jgi:hypothetical protein
MSRSRRISLPVFGLIVGGCALLALAGCSGGSSSDAERTSQQTTHDCASLEPDNPYEDGSGHFAGYEWAEEKGGASCGGNSDSFNEGCEEYGEQLETYEQCQSRQ